MKDIPLTIKDTQQALGKRKFSAVDLVDAYLERIEKFDSEINAFNTVSSELAYSQAKQVDKLIKEKGATAFKEFPLLGVCVSYKDMFMTKGVRTTASSNVLKSYIPQYSATAVKRLEKAGCISIGKTNQDAWAHGSSGENSDFGPTKNPWNQNFVPGGSSSGSGASLAANFTLVSTGTDTCGSIRLPANYCGVYGLKPTYGSVSRYGIIAMASSLDSIGHFARNVDDIERVLQITKGKDMMDSTLDEIGYKTSKNLTIGIPKQFFGEGLDQKVKKSIDEALSVYRELGVKTKYVDLPHTKYAISTYYIIQPAEVSSNLGRYDGIRYGGSRSSFADEAKRRIMLGSYVLSSGYYDAYYLRAMKVRTILRKEIAEVFEKVDALIAPVAPTPPFRLGDKVDDPIQMYLTDIYAATANLTGIPGLAIPYGFTENNLPLGFQLMGRKFSESLLFYLARIFEKKTKYKPSIAPLLK